MEIRKQLKAIRALTGISQKDLAARAGVTQKQVSLIEGGKDCCISTLRRLLNEMGYDMVAVPIERKEGGDLGE